jgi:hypothetical protein
MAKKEDIYWVYVKWEALPASQRKPSSREEFCLRYDLTLADLFSFQEAKSYSDDLNNETMKWAKRKTPEMLHVLYEKYRSTKNPQDLKIWQDAIQEHEKTQVQTTLDDLVAEYEISETQLCSLAYRILAVYDPNLLLKEELMPDMSITTQM